VTDAGSFPLAIVPRAVSTPPVPIAYCDRLAPFQFAT
jgi:hypothetical protein